MANAFLCKSAKMRVDTSAAIYLRQILQKSTYEFQTTSSTFAYLLHAWNLAPHVSRRTTRQHPWCQGVRIETIHAGKQGLYTKHYFIGTKTTWNSELYGNFASQNEEARKAWTKSSRAVSNAVVGSGQDLLVALVHSAAPTNHNA